MSAPLKQPTHEKTTKLLSQEKEGKSQFDRAFVADPGAVKKFGEAVIIAAHITLLKKVKRKGGLDYLQVFEIDGEKL